MKQGKKLYYIIIVLKQGRNMKEQKPSEDTMAKCFQNYVKDIKTKIQDSVSIHDNTKLHMAVKPIQNWVGGKKKEKDFLKSCQKTEKENFSSN